MKVKHIAFTCVGMFLATAAASPLYAFQKQAIEKAAIQSKVASSETIGFNVYLPSRNRSALEALLTQFSDSNSPNYHKWLTPAQLHAQFGPDAASLSAVQRELSAYGLATTLTSAHQIHVTGSAGQVAQVLGTTFQHGVMPSGKSVIVAGRPLSLPGSIGNAGGVVTGLSGTIRMHHDIRRAATPQNRYSPVGPYWFDDLKQAYSWPSYKKDAGKGTTIAILVDGGYNRADMNAYFGHEKLATPQISVVNVLGGAPFSTMSNGSFEAELDIQQSGGMAPKAHIVLYSIPDLSETSIIAGLAQIIEDNKADVVNMSFGGAERAYTPEYNGGVDYTPILRAEDDLMAEGNALGITFVAASGDEGAKPLPAAACFFTTADPCGTFVASAEFPASSPHVTAVGGTNLSTTYDSSSPNLNSRYISEEAYADPLKGDPLYGTKATGAVFGSGGGNSVVFKKPGYQKLVDTGDRWVRTVPDVALHMGGCPGGAVSCNPDDSADVEAFGGQFTGVIGTSASSPDFAGLTALNVERFGNRMGNENNYIYLLAVAQKAGFLKIFHQGIRGYNGLYSSGNDGYNRVLGNGTLYGKNFLLAPEFPSAGIPQSPSNP